MGVGEYEFFPGTPKANFLFLKKGVSSEDLREKLKTQLNPERQVNDSLSPPYFPSGTRSGSKCLRNKRRIKVPRVKMVFFLAQSIYRTHGPSLSLPSRRTQQGTSLWQKSTGPSK